MIPDCIYEVHTHWGWFRLDEGAYADYLAGKLWITWVPGRPRRESPRTAVPVNVSEQALRLRELAARSDADAVCRRFFPAGTEELPYRRGMSGLSIEEMCLSARASNGLMRAGAFTLGHVMSVMAQEKGLRGIRNLGEKSEQEIRQSFFNCCYRLLNEYEKAAWWQSVINANSSAPPTDKFM